jgi:MFS family permease
MPWIGKLAGRFGKKRIMSIGVTLSILSGLLLIFANNILQAGIALILLYLGGVMRGMNADLVVSENSAESKKGSNFSLMYFAASSTSIASYLFALLDIGISSRFYLVLYIVMESLVYIVLLFIIEPTNSKKEDIKRKELLSENKLKKNVLSEIFQTRKTRIIVVFFTINSFVFGLAVSIWNAWMVDIYGVTQQELALLFLVLNFSLMIFQIPAGRIIDKIGHKKALLISESCFLISTSLSIIVFFIWSNGFLSVLIPGTIIGIIVYVLYESIFFPVESIYLTNLTEDRKAESFGTVGLITDGSRIPTSMISGSLVDFVHPISHSIVSCGGLVLLIGYLIKFFDNEKPVEED